MPSIPETFVSLLLLAFVAAVACVDLATRRIPNVLTVSAVGLVVAFYAALGGVSGLMLAIGGLLVGLGMTLPFYLAGGFGAGDVKAMAVVGAFLGPLEAILAVACTLVVGALMGVGMLMMLGGLRPLLHRWLYAYAPIWVVAHLPAGKPPVSEAAVYRFPYGLAIAAGTALALWWRGPPSVVLGG